MRRVAVINQKGGVGKTTTVVNHGAALALFGKRVLLIDMDPQANLSLHLNRLPEPGTKSITNLLLDDTPLDDLILETAVENVHVVPADTVLAGVELGLADRIGRETILREAFEAMKDGPGRYDWVLMDCPPSLGVLSANALVAAHDVLIPVQAEYFALQGTAKLLEVIQLVQRRLNPELEVASVLPCKVDLRTKLAEEVLLEIERHFGSRMAETLIRMNVKLAEAPSFGRTIFEHAPESNGALDHEAFAIEFLAAHGEHVEPISEALRETEEEDEEDEPEEEIDTEVDLDDGTEDEDDSEDEIDTDGTDLDAEATAEPEACGEPEAVAETTELDPVGEAEEQPSEPPPTEAAADAQIENVVTPVPEVPTPAPSPHAAADGHG